MFSKRIFGEYVKTNNASSFSFGKVCPAGRYGDNCSLFCPINYYGILCTEACDCRFEERCDFKQGCILGKYFFFFKNIPKLSVRISKCLTH